MPVWVQIDAPRFSRMMVQVLSKVINTLPEGGALSIAVSQAIQGNFRGVEILIQDQERSRGGRGTLGGPDQDILKHWISENGLSMALANKIVKAHGGTITAAGVAGMSVTVTIRLPHERVVSRGLISPPSDNSDTVARGLNVAKQKADGQTSTAG
jgi:signal transduction histidine kinase